MGKKWAVRVSVAALVSVGLAAPLFARAMIYDILTKGSEWTLNVDGEVGTLKLLGGRGSRTSEGGREMTMDVEWQGRAGRLRGWADGANSEQRVTLELDRSGGFAVTLHGVVARETDGFMAGTSRYAAVPDDVEGAWFATQGATSPPAPGAGRIDSSQVADRSSAPVGKLRATAPKMEVQPVEKPAATCRVGGRVTGRRGLVGAVAVYASDSERQLQKVEPAKDGTFGFRPLPDGTYKVLPLAGGKFDLRSRPRSLDVTCRGSQAPRADFEILGISEG